MKEYNNIFYAIKKNKEFQHLFDHINLTKLCDSGPYFKVKVREAEEGEKSSYWGWRDSEDKDYSMIYPSKTLLGMCFPSGIEGAEKAGKGKAVNLIVEELGEVEV